MTPFKRSFESTSSRVRASLVALLAVVLTACGGGLDPMLGTPDVGAVPRVTATTPVASVPVVTGVATNSRISAAFSEPMSAATLTASSFTLACPAGTPVAASIAYDAATRVATLTPSALLPAGTPCVATLSTAVQDSTGHALASAFVWGFTTAPAADLTPPTVAMTSPAAGAVNVANNMQIAATFSEDMRPASLTGTSFTVVDSTLGTAVAGSVSYSATSRTAMFTPTAPATLADNTTYTATVTTGATDLAGNALALNHVWTFSTAAAPDTTAPTVVLAHPAPNATAVPINGAISVTFSEPMNPARISGSTFTLVNNTLGAAIPGNVTYSATSRMAIFTPSTPALLAANSSFTATVTTGVTDAAGNALATNFVWTFTTAAAADTIRPSVVLTVPERGANPVPINSAISATFSEAMNPATISGASFTLVSAAGNRVAGSVTYSAISRTAVFTPGAPSTLAANTVFTATITTSAADVAGNALEADYVWTFTTGNAPDTTAPTVVLTVPTHGATAVPINTAISATFSEDMAPASIGVASFTLVNSTLGGAVVGTVSYSAISRTALFTPSTPTTLAANTRYIATLTTGNTDVAGNPLAANVVWSFTTASAPDVTRPTVVLTVPASNATGVPVNSTITATFSEDMNPDTISGASFIVIDTTTGNPLPGQVSYSPTSRTAIFTPSMGALAASRQFRATIGTGAGDLAGNVLAADVVWTFTTAAAPDTTQPAVVLTVPTDGATGVAVNTAISATFSEDMNPARVSTSSFTVTNLSQAGPAPGGGTPVAGTVSYSAISRTAVFMPSAGALPANSQFRVLITSANTDLAGNPLPAAVVWSFSTAASPDSTAPTVITVSPPDGSSMMCLGRSVSATFSEPMNATTIGPASFVVSDGGAAVAGVVSYDAASRVVTFVPGASTGFAPSRSFVVTVVSGNAGVKDLAGNPLAADRTWGFSTGTQACVGAVSLGSAAAFGGFGGAAGVTNQGVNTTVGGNLGSTAVCTAITGFHDAANVYTETPLNVGAVNGSIYCAPPAPGNTTTLAIASQARADAQAAYDMLAALPPGGDPGAGQLGGLVLPAAVYTSASGSFSITGGDLTLDAQGDVNAVWVFQSAASLTVGQPALPRRVLLINGAQARNVFWQVGSAARIEDRSVMVGTIIAPAGVTISSAGQAAQTLLTGRAIGLTASVTMVNTTIVTP